MMMMMLIVMMIVMMIVVVMVMMIPGASSFSTMFSLNLKQIISGGKADN